MNTDRHSWSRNDDPRAGEGEHGGRSVEIYRRYIHKKETNDG